MLQIVPDEDAAAKSLVSSGLLKAFQAEMNERHGEGDFAKREQVALALANEVVRADLTEALKSIVTKHGTQGVLVNGQHFRLHTWGTGSYASLVGTLVVKRPTFRKVGATARRWWRWTWRRG